jgi:hypothetical protein
MRNAFMSTELGVPSTPGMSGSLALGSGAAFDPISLSPQLWLDASDLDTIFVSGVSQTIPDENGVFGYWKDKSGFGRHCTGLNSPRVNNSIYNGLRAVRLDGYYRQEIRTGLSHLIDTVDVYILWNKIGDPPSGSSVLWGSVGIPGGGSLNRFQSTTNTSGYRSAVMSGGYRRTYHTDTTLPSGVEVNNTRFSLSKLGGSHNFGQPSYVDHSRAPTTTPSVFRIGSDEGGFNSISPNGHLLEVVVFDYFLSNNQRAKLKKYWENKWGITLTPPTVPVAPVGFSPLVLEPQLWLDAADTETIFISDIDLTTPLDNQGFAYWKDKSGFNRHSTGRNSPVVVNSSYNGLRSVRMNGSFRQEIRTGLSHLMNVADVYILWNKLANTSNPFSGWAFIWGSVGVTGGGSLHRFYLTTDNTQNRVVTVPGGVNRNLQTTSLPSGVEAINPRFTTSQIGGSYNFSEPEYSTHSANLTTTPSVFRVGSDEGGLSSVSPHGDILEIVVFNYFLDNAQRQQLKAYWETKWAVQFFAP